jgi:predicted peroxiredoxin
MEDDTQLMFTMEGEIPFLLKKKRETKLKNGLTKPEIKPLTFIFTVRAIVS